VEVFPVERIRDVYPRYRLGKDPDVKTFEETVMKHGDCNLIVSMVGLPREFWKMSFLKWGDSTRPKMAFLDGDTRSVPKLVKDGKACLFAAYKPGWTYTAAAPSDKDAAFSMRYLLIGPEGVCQIPFPVSQPAQAQAKGN